MKKICLPVTKGGLLAQEQIHLDVEFSKCQVLSRGARMWCVFGPSELRFETSRAWL